MSEERRWLGRLTREELADHFRLCGTALLCSADHRVQAIDAAVFPVCAGVVVAGPATTARAKPDDNAVVHRAVNSASPGDILVVDSGRDRTRAMFGDILGEACQRRGLAGVIVRGSVRDVASLRAMTFPLWSTSIHAAPAAKAWPGEVNVPLDWQGVRLCPGDWVVADDDGVVLMPAAFVVDVTTRSEALSRREKIIRSRLAAGESTCAIFGIDP